MAEYALAHASTKETERFFRLTKAHQKRKIDACAALSFAILAAIRYGRPVDIEDYKEPVIDGEITHSLKGW
jgi:hypothetical protein